MSNYFAANSNSCDTVYFIWAHDLATAESVAEFTLELEMHDDETGEGYQISPVERADMTAEEIAEAEAVWATYAAGVAE